MNGTFCTLCRLGICIQLVFTHSGFYSPIEDSTFCSLCSRGSYSNVLGASSCNTCPIGRYGSDFGATSNYCSGKCESVAGSFCDVGTTSMSGIPCGVGYYSISTGLNFKSSCVKCLSGFYSIFATSSQCELVSPSLCLFFLHYI